MKCPLCDNEAISPHHIKSRSEGGTNDSRNIVFLCKRCHDEVEIECLNFTPDLITNKRREYLSAKATSQEEYWYIQRPDGLLFIGIKTPGEKEMRHFDIFIPDDSISLNSQRTFLKPLGTKIIKRNRGRPRLTVDWELVGKLKNQGLSLRNIEEMTDIPIATLSRGPKENGIIS